MTATGGRIGNFEISGGNLSNLDDSDCWVSIDYTDKDGSRRVSSLGNNLPGIAGFTTAGYFSATGTHENIALKINASGSKTYDTKYDGKANYALITSGGCQWKLSDPGDIWCMPGVLKCLEMYSYRDGNTVHYSINKQWGNGLKITGYELNSEREYWFTHDLGHTNYYPVAFPSGQRESDSWHGCFGSCNGLSANSFNIIFWGHENGKCYPKYFTLVIFGIPK